MYLQELNIIFILIKLQELYIIMFQFHELKYELEIQKHELIQNQLIKY